MDDLVARFKDEARERAGNIERLAAGDEADRLSAIREESHKLKGAAGMLGFPELKERAAELEDLVANDLGSDGALDAAVAALVAALPN